ncbi:TerC family protein [Algoriphagus boritolerans]|uniref:Membrane protein TerC, possibly involved in tellurium resistance n=1 Tax=Algoriphagus boritolerans DSM 17298 = JCM 18970 TaxID=1120964 RepID=A0A1H5XCR9_9BACT|nr:TerC family protein [Algoriphagus boritolerans]SEG09574.1 Membrane protein TerC, possibly involved in tellurium resistance [Algoriphagus boritolerans DSM 17298 = JCM 18970]
MEIFLQTDTWIALLTLTFLEIVLGVDNIIFISIVSNKLPVAQQAKARNLGLMLALFFRVALLLGISYIIKFTQPLFTILDHDFSGRDLILLVGGLFLLFKSTLEIHHKMEGEPEEIKVSAAKSLRSVLVQIVFLDIIFSFDSILTAVGLVDEVIIMIIAVVISLGVMMAFAGKISAFINKHPTLQILALSFLILIGFMLLLEGFHFEVPKGYIYFAVFFSLAVEMVNLRMKGKSSKPVKLKPRMTEEK